MRGESVTIRERTRAIKFGEGVELCELGIILDSWKAKKGTRLMTIERLNTIEDTLSELIGGTINGMTEQLKGINPAYVCPVDILELILAATDAAGERVEVKERLNTIKYLAESIKADYTRG